MQFCSKRQVLDGIEFGSAAIRARLDFDFIRIGLEIANCRVERIQQNFVGGVVCVINT